jgi:triosephosphate isomerase
MTPRLIIANWKMNGDLALVETLASSLPSLINVQTVIAPPAVYALRMAELAQDVFKVGLQDVGRHESGAHTGEVSAAMARDLGASIVLVGHSERRSEHAEDDATVAAKC